MIISSLKKQTNNFSIAVEGQKLLAGANCIEGRILQQHVSSKIGLERIYYFPFKSVLINTVFAASLWK